MHVSATVRAGQPKDSIEHANGRCRITTREKAKDGRANRAAILLLARHLGVPPARISLVRGAHTPSKLFVVRK